MRALPGLLPAQEGKLCEREEPVFVSRRRESPVKLGQGRVGRAFESTEQIQTVEHLHRRGAGPPGGQRVGGELLVNGQGVHALDSHGRRTRSER